MLQIETTQYASDALEDAMRLAQIKALNSFTFSDCVSYLNYAWSDIYKRMAAIDSGYYSRTVRLTEELTKLPPYVANTVKVYSAQRPVGYDRLIYRASGTADMTATGTYHLSGFDLYCPDAKIRTVWLEYVPVCSQLFFPMYNRDPKVLDTVDDTWLTYGQASSNYGAWELQGDYVYTDDGDTLELSADIDKTAGEASGAAADQGARSRGDYSQVNKWYFQHKLDRSSQVDITDYIIKEEDEYGAEWRLVYISCDYPYIFCSYKNTASGEYRSGFFNREMEWTDYNPFDFAGRGSNVEYIACRWNDKTGLGVTVINHNDDDKVQELGWTPDTKLDYPAPEMYRYLVARLADKFAALNESNVMGVQKELVEARYAFEAFLDKDKSAWTRIENVNSPSWADML